MGEEKKYGIDFLYILLVIVCYIIINHFLPNARLIGKIICALIASGILTFILELLLAFIIGIYIHKKEKK